MSQAITEEQRAEIKEIFQLFAKGGSISTRELLTIMRAAGQNPSEEEVKAIIEEVDENATGKINFNKFLSLMTKRLKDTEDSDL